MLLVSRGAIVLMILKDYKIIKFINFTRFQMNIYLKLYFKTQKEITGMVPQNYHTSVIAMISRFGKCAEVDIF